MIFIDKSDSKSSATLFAEIHDAWVVLSNPVKRSEVDRFIALEQLGPVCDDVLLSDLTLTESGNFTKECRCGDIFEV